MVGIEVDRRREAYSSGAFLTVFVGFGLISGIGAFQTYYRTELLSEYSEWVSVSAAVRDPAFSLE